MEAARSAGGTPCRPRCREKPRLGSRTTIRLGAAKWCTMIKAGCEGAEVSGDSAQSPSPEKNKSARPAIRNDRMADLATCQSRARQRALIGLCCQSKETLGLRPVASWSMTTLGPRRQLTRAKAESGFGPTVRIGSRPEWGEHHRAQPP